MLGVSDNKAPTEVEVVLGIPAKQAPPEVEVVLGATNTEDQDDDPPPPAVEHPASEVEPEAQFEVVDGSYKLDTVQAPLAQRADKGKKRSKKAKKTRRSDM